MCVLVMSAERLKILLIEHDPGFVEALGQLIGTTRDLTADLTAAVDLRSGIQALNRDSFDIVMCDVALPDGAGLANVFLIRAEAPELPIIVAGESDSETMAVEAVHAGAQDYLVKQQLSPSWLERSIRYAIERQRMDRALQEAEEKYHGVFDHLVEGIFQTSPDGRYLMANLALARIYGYDSPEELMQTLTDISLSLYVKPGRREDFVAAMQESDVLTGFESQVFRKNGSIIWISENCRAIRDNLGRLLYYEGTVEDISQRQIAEARLRDSETLYHSLVETLPQNIFRKDLNGRFTFANQQFCRTLGLKLEEIVGKTDFDFFPAELAAKYQKDDRQLIATGKLYDCVEENQPPGHEKMYVQVVKTPLYGADGLPVGLQGIFWDITTQRRAEENLRKAHALLEQNRKELHEKNQQMEDDLKMAQDIQLTLLPQDYPAFRAAADQTSTAFQFTHRYLPTGSVGGDFFTISEISEHQAGVFFCDVAGHGVRAALVTAMIRALVEKLKPNAHDPGVFLTKLNSDLCAILKHTGTPLLTTAFYLVADCVSDTLRYANAGHPKPLHVRRQASAVNSLRPPRGKPQAALGLFENATYHTAEFAFVPGDFLLLYTDGLVEVQDNQDDLYTPAQLTKALEKGAHLPAGELLDALLGEVRAFCAEGFTDDVCLLGIDYAALPSIKPA